MSTRRPGKTSDAASFSEAMAQWRLAVRTEVKRSSLLPTSMFDACDPMLETRLAETAEAMLTRLQEPSAQVVGPATPAGEQRLESVSIDELRTLPQCIGSGADPHLDLDTGLLAEYLAVLTDSSRSGQPSAQAGAVQLLARDFGITLHGDAATIAATLMASVQQAITDPAAGSDVDDWCQRIAATVALHQRDLNERETRGDGGPR